MSRFDDLSSALKSLEVRKLDPWESYYGFYSSWFGGYFREPWAMLIPMDDHGFHRGDGVFEAVRVLQGAYFDLESHLHRLARSADKIGMQLPKSHDEMIQICIELAKRCKKQDGILRLYVTRGPGSFSPNPADVVGHQIYMALTKLSPPSNESYQNGVTAMFSTVEAKEPFWSQIKSCNYLQNVLMKQECVQRGVDFAISVDVRGRICEGSTENLMVISAENELKVPKFDYTLRGTTVSLVMKLAEDLVKDNRLSRVLLADITREDIFKAREVAFVGTTLGVLSIREVDGQAVGDPSTSAMTRVLHERLLKQMQCDSALRTPF